LHPNRIDFSISDLVTKGNLAETLGDEGKNAEAERIIRETLESEHRTLGPDHTDTLVTMESTANNALRTILTIGLCLAKIVTELYRQIKWLGQRCVPG
jgi:hypothetical protein